MENLEKNIKNKLQQSQIDIDTDELWNEVYPHIKPKRNRKVLLFILMGFLWLFSLVAVGYYFQSDSISDVKVAEVETEKKSPIITDETTNKAEAKVLDEVPNVSSSVISTVVEEEAKNDNLISVVRQETPAAEKEGQEETSLNKIIKKNIATDKKTPQANTEKIIVTTRNVDESLNNHSRLNDKSHLVQLDNSQNAKEEFNVEKSSNTKPITRQEKFTLNKSETSSSILLSLATLESAISKLTYNYPQPIIPNEFYAEHNYKRDFSKFSIYVLGGISKISRTLALRDNLFANDLVQREAAESPLESIAGELGLSYEIRTNLRLSAGVNYIRFNERIEDSFTITDTVLLENVIIENIISSRGSEPVFGNIRSARTVVTDLKAYNRYSDLALSVDLTYLLRTRGVMPYVSAGLQQSISTSQSGYWLVDTNDLYDLSEDKSSYISNNYGLGLRFGVGVTMDISDRTSLQIGGRYIKYLNPITTNEYNIKQKYDLLGLSAGLNIKI